MSQIKGSARLRPQDRIRKSRDFQECRDKGSKVFSRHLICQFHKNQLSQSRFGLIVTRKTGSAVVRNRWKRVLRDFFRRNADSFHGPMDYVFVVKSNVKHRPPITIHDELAQLLGKIRM